jgi:hypothetical protein
MGDARLRNALAPSPTDRRNLRSPLSSVQSQLRRGWFEVLAGSAIRLTPMSWRADLLPLNLGTGSRHQYKPWYARHRGATAMATSMALPLIQVARACPAV